MAVFKFVETEDGVEWTLFRSTGDAGSGLDAAGGAIARGVKPYTDESGARDAVLAVRLIAPGAEIEALDTKLVSEGNMRVGTQRVVARTLPSTPLASPSSIPTGDGEEDEEDEEEAQTVRVAAGPRGRKAGSAVSSSLGRPGRAAKPTVPASKPGTAQVKPTGTK